MSLCLCACQTCRPAGGHVGRARQLQHHSQRAEAFLQQAARGERPLGESQSRRSPSVSVVWEGECISDTSRGAALRGCDHIAQTRKMVRVQTTTPQRFPIQGPPCIIDSGDGASSTCAEENKHGDDVRCSLPHLGRSGGTQKEERLKVEGRRRYLLIIDSNPVVKEIGQVVFMLLNFTSACFFLFKKTPPLPLLRSLSLSRTFLWMSGK